VVDDHNDIGIDAIVYGGKKTLYLVQSKLKLGAEFQLTEALKFIQGCKKIIQQDFEGFNANVQARREGIRKTLDDCEAIQLVVAHIGPRISGQAEQAFNDFVTYEKNTEC
jgi:hypothetical protein